MTMTNALVTSPLLEKPDSEFSEAVVIPHFVRWCKYIHSNAVR